MPKVSSQMNLVFKQLLQMFCHIYEYPQNPYVSTNLNFPSVEDAAMHNNPGTPIPQALQCSNECYQTTCRVIPWMTPLPTFLMAYERNLGV